MQCVCTLYTAAAVNGSPAIWWLQLSVCPAGTKVKSSLSAPDHTGTLWDAALSGARHRVHYKWWRVYVLNWWINNCYSVRHSGFELSVGRSVSWLTVLLSLSAFPSLAWNETFPFLGLTFLLPCVLGSSHSCRQREPTCCYVSLASHHVVEQKFYDPQQCQTFRVKRNRSTLWPVRAVCHHVWADSFLIVCANIIVVDCCVPVCYMLYKGFMSLALWSSLCSHSWQRFFCYSYTANRRGYFTSSKTARRSRSDHGACLCSPSCQNNCGWMAMLFLVDTPNYTEHTSVNRDERESLMWLHLLALPPPLSLSISVTQTNTHMHLM